MYDSYHILHNLYKNLRNKADIRYYVNMIHAKNEAELTKQASIAHNKLDNRPGTPLDHFLKNKHVLLPQLSMQDLFGLYIIIICQ
jgi:hypothetical protein